LVPKAGLEPASTSFYLAHDNCLSMHGSLGISILNFQFYGRYYLRFYDVVRGKYNHLVILLCIRRYYNDEE
jgi:hypothetical protein